MIRLLSILASVLVLAACTEKQNTSLSNTERYQIDSLRTIVSVEEDSIENPFSISVFGGDKLSILDTDRREIRVYRDNGEFLYSFGQEGKGPGEFVHPRGMFVRDSIIIVTDVSTMRLTKFTTQGKFKSISRMQKETQFFGMMAVGEPYEYFTVANGYKGKLVGHHNLKNDTTTYFGEAFAENPPSVSKKSLKEGIQDHRIPPAIQNDLIMAYHDGVFYGYVRNLSRLQKYEDEKLQWDIKLSPEVNEVIYSQFEAEVRERGFGVMFFGRAIAATSNSVYLLWDRTKKYPNQVIKVSSSGEVEGVYKLPHKRNGTFFHVSDLAVDEEKEILYLASNYLHEVYVADMP